MRIVLALVLLLVTFVAYYQFQPLRSFHFDNPFFRELVQQTPQIPRPSHPIDDLLRAADIDHQRLLDEEVHSLTNAAAAYRVRRGRHPPPRFDEWVTFAKEHDVLLIEELYDQIYHDLEPFWAMPPQQMRDAVAGWEFVLSVRNGNLTVAEDPRFRMDLWHDMLSHIMHLLPDVDLAINIMDESRVIVASEKMEEYMDIALDSRHVNTQLPLEQSFSSLALLEPKDSDHPWTKGGNYWMLAREGCPLSTPARHAEPVLELTSVPEFPTAWPNASYQGYVSNWTIAKDPCSHAHLRGLHGSFIEPISISTTPQLFPVLGGSKLPMNNDILIPAAHYWDEALMFSGGAEAHPDWSSKHDKLIWRGVASGGRHKADTWTHYQRHRFLAMLNSSHVRSGLEDPLTSRTSSIPLDTAQDIFPLHEAISLYNVTPPSTLPTWLDTIASDVGFVDMECFPSTSPKSLLCPHTDPFFALAPKMPMSQMFDYKYLPDIDGNSYSGRYRGFLRSHSLPLKATIYSEWHDSRLVAWKHFVPLDSTYVDFYGVMDYLLGRDQVGKRIAREGREWAERVLRREDMLAYVYRLVLEYARVVDERRVEMGFVGDVMT